MACFIQLWAATIFWVSTMSGFLFSSSTFQSAHTETPRAGLPNVIPGFPNDPPTAITDVFYWTPQVIGGTGFIISSVLFMLEVSSKWWLPNVRSIGW